MSDGQTSLLLDLGMKIEWVRKALNFKLSDVQAALVTHKHLDHCKYMMQFLTHGIDVYTHKDVIELFNSTHYRLNEIDDKQMFTIGTFKILPFEVKHDVYNLNFLITSTVTHETLVYITDTPYIPFKFSNNITHMLVEANHDVPTIEHLRATEPKRFKRVRETHMSIETLESYLNGMNTQYLKQVNIIHTSNQNATTDDYVERIKAITGCIVKLGVN